jgi:hypothetical protein
MKKAILILVLCLGLLIVAAPVMAADTCKSITKGEVVYGNGLLAGTPIPTGFDAYGYNYQAHMFSGSYFNSYARGAGFPVWEGDDAAYLAINPTASSHWAWPYREDNLAMKWNDAWISNKDCSGDNLLDRHFGLPSYRGSGAWLTNHQSGTYEVDGKTYKWNYFCKIVAVPVDATKVGGIWYAANGTVIGPDIWGEFATIEEVYNDTGTGDHGILYNAPAPTGFGPYKP